jgi:hypothetical protein
MTKGRGIKVIQSVLGPTYTLGDTTIAFRPAGPKLIIGDQIYAFNEPERFGKWGTEMQRRQFIQAFVNSLDEKPEWETI